MKYLVTLEHVTIRYKRGLQTFTLFNDISCSIPSHYIGTITGHNGSGKTTLLKIIAGLIPITQGSLQYKTNIRRGYIPEQCSPPPWLTGYEYLTYAAQLQNIPDAHQKIIQLFDKLELISAMHTIMRYYSKGMQQKICIAQALIGNPDLLLLDEPFSGLDDRSKKIVEELCFNNTNRTVIFSTHAPTHYPILFDTIATHMTTELPTKYSTGKSI